LQTKLARTFFLLQIERAVGGRARKVMGVR
jgi:hypothetical protein